MRIAVAGGTGTVGRHVVGEAETRGHEVLVLARSTGVDLTTGAGLAGRLAGVDAVVDVTSSHTQRRSEAESFFGSITRTLLSAEEAAGVGHHLALSIVGIDDVPSGYYRGKQLQERLIVQGPVPWTILRATQFHEFAVQALGFSAFGRFSLVPRMTTQPIAAREVAAAILDAVEAGPVGRLPDLGGPERLELVTMARAANRARGLGRRVIAVRVPGAWGRGLRSGALCPTGAGPRGRESFDDWLLG